MDGLESQHEMQVKSSLENIERFTCVMQEELKKFVDIPNDIDIEEDVFCGCMTHSDFARYVYFEYCAGQFIKQDSFKTVRQHVDDLMASDQDRNGACGFLYGAYQKCPDSLRRQICRHIKKMIENRAIYLPMVADASDWEALIKLLTYGTGRIEDRMDGVPIGKSYIYQALTSVFALDGVRDLYGFLSNKRTSAKAMRDYFDGQIGFFREVLLDEDLDYSNENCVEDYIARAINLVKFEDRRKLNALYSMANRLANHKFEGVEDSWEAIHGKCFTGPIPPVFSDCVVLFPYEVKNGQGFYPEYHLQSICNFIRSLFPGISRPPHCPGQVLQYEKYLDYFVKSSALDCHYEEIRFYIIQMLAQYYLYAIKKNCIEVSYSNEQFAYFIEHYYNIFNAYQLSIDLREKHPLTKQMASIIRKTAAEMHLPDSPKTDP